MTEKKADILLEASWEVCNKVGGINTVIKSKMPKILEHYTNHDYIAIGPYIPEKAMSEFEEVPPPEDYEDVCKELEKEGLQVHFGKWLIKGEPFTILIDFSNYWYKLNDIKKELWDNFQISSIRAGNDYNEPLLWSYASGRVVECFTKNKKVVAHFHEWLSGAGLLYLKSRNVKVSTVFTTHATILGRTLASSGVDLYNVFDKINADQEAYNYGIEAKFHLEKQSALNATIFTTVSEITGLEAEHLLGRKPDILLPNGLDIEKFPTFEEGSVEHKIFKEKIKRFLMYYFYPYYQFDMKETLIYFLAGRYEFRDKGIDVFINALAKLNEKMKAKKSKKTIVAFIWVPADVHSIDTHLLQNQTNFEDIKDAVDDDSARIRTSILSTLLSSKRFNENNVLGPAFMSEMKKKILKFKKKGNPELTTHHLNNKNDEIIRALYSSGLDNMKDDPVKVIFYPIYLTGADGLLDLNYYESMQGSHLGIFPSFYEPWGYTPLEAAALGVSSVTTDLAGFGRYISKEMPEEETPGVFVLKRENKSDNEISNSLAKFMFKFSKYSTHERVQNKLKAKEIAAKADWKFMITEYIKAHNLAIEKVY